MQLLPKPERGRWIALLLLVGALALLYFGGVHWWFTARHLDIAAQMADLTEQEARFRRVAGERSVVEANLADVRKFEADNPAFLAETDFDSASANLTQRFKQIIGRHARNAQSCQVISQQYERFNDKELFERAGIRVRLRCSLEELAPIVHELESGSPMLFLSELQIWKQGDVRVPGGGQPTGPLDVQFVLSGYMRKRTVETKEGG